MKSPLSFLLASVLPAFALAQAGPATHPSNLPGNGLAQHDFLYAGEFETRKPVQTLWVIKGGKVAWSYAIPSKTPDGVSQELDDATMLPNGNILFSHLTGASEITPEKKSSGTTTPKRELKSTSSSHMPRAR